MGPSMKQVKRILSFIHSNLFLWVYFKRKIVSLHCTIGFYLTFGWEHFVRKAKKISNYKTDLYILPWSMVGRKSIIVVQEHHVNKLLDKAKILIIRSTNAKSLATMKRVKICFIINMWWQVCSSFKPFQQKELSWVTITVRDNEGDH